MQRPRRKPVHFGVFLVIGLAMFALARVVISKGVTEHPEAMQLFSWIGLLFTGIGVIKFVIVYSKKQKLAQKEERFAEKKAGLPQPRSKEQVPHTKKTPPVIIACSKCGVKNYSSSHFCHMCGTQLPKR